MRSRNSARTGAPPSVKTGGSALRSVLGLRDHYDARGGDFSGNILGQLARPTFATGTEEVAWIADAGT
jgi:hypothetical protein